LVVCLLLSLPYWPSLFLSFIFRLP
jgi:hypothetical protein